MNNNTDSGNPARSNRIINAGSPSHPTATTNIQTPPRIINNGPPELIRGRRAFRNGDDEQEEDLQQLPLPLQIFNDADDDVPDNFENVFFDEQDNDNRPANAAEGSRTNERSPTSSIGFGKKMTSQKKFIKKYMKLGHSRKRALAKYHKAKLQFGQ